MEILLWEIVTVTLCAIYEFHSHNPEEGIAKDPRVGKICKKKVSLGCGGGSCDCGDQLVILLE